MSDREGRRRQAYESGRIDTTDGQQPQSFDTAAPGPIEASGMHSQYWVLSADERAKGFVRPVRRSYVHVGIAGPRFPLRDVTDAERETWGERGWVKYEEYLDRDPEHSAVGRFWTQEDLDNVGRGCRTVTTMGVALAETYAREPGFYGSTFCCGCGKHLPVGRDGEFVWAGTEERERVGT